MDKNDSDILYYIEEFPIRAKNKLSLSLNENEYVKIVHAHIASNRQLSIPKIIAIQGQACQQCGHSSATIVVPKGILSLKRSTSGGTISSKNKKP